MLVAIMAVLDRVSVGAPVLDDGPPPADTGLRVELLGEGKGAIDWKSAASYVFKYQIS